MRTQGWSDVRFALIADVALGVAGLVFPPARQPSVESAMRRVMTALDLADPGVLLQAVKQPGAARDALIAELTVGESYFFREEGALGVLEHEILSARRAAGRGREALRIWSAGCATGEEPFTLAMLLREHGWQQDLQILGTDISLPRLEVARRGRYTSWSLRGVSQPRIDRWFSRRGNRFVVHDAVRHAVRYEQLNLAAEDDDSSLECTTEQDLILCRNVLIYFDLATVAKVAARLLRSLRPDGLLLLGASDPPLADLVQCRTVTTPFGTVYQRDDGDASAPRPLTAIAIHRDGPPGWAYPHELPGAPSSELLSPTDESVRPQSMPEGMAMATAAVRPSDAAAAYARGDYPGAAEAAELAVELDAREPRPWILWIRALANIGQLVRAGEVAVEAIRWHRLEPELHYLHGVLLLEMQHVAEAAHAARRAVYLDRAFVMGYMLLGDTLARLGNAEAARRAFENAQRRLDVLPENATVPASDGVSRSRLRQVVLQRLGPDSVQV